MDKKKSSTNSIDNWQRGKSIVDCNLHMLKSEEYCDVTFKVGDAVKEIVKAHRYMLMSRSSVFCRMLYGDLAEKGDIEVTDVEPDHFRELLKFLYTDEVYLKDNNASWLLYLAKKYDVGGLEQRCIWYLEKSLSPEKACYILHMAHSLNETKLVKKALSVIALNGSKCLKTAGFKDLSYECIEKILSSDELIARESPETIFNAALLWAGEECQRKREEPTPGKLRSVLQQTLFNIPFQNMNKEHFVDRVLPKKILEDKETVAIMACLICPQKDPFPFKRRKIIEPQNTIKKGRYS